MHVHRCIYLHTLKPKEPTHKSQSHFESIFQHVELQEKAKKAPNSKGALEQKLFV